MPTSSATPPPAAPRLRGGEKLWVYARWLAAALWCVLLHTTPQPVVPSRAVTFCLLALGASALLHVLTHDRLLHHRLTTGADLLLVTFMCGVSGGLQSAAYPYFFGVTLATTLRFGLAEGLAAAAASSGLSLLFLLLPPAAQVTGMTVALSTLFLFLLAGLSGLLRPEEQPRLAPQPGPANASSADTLSALYRPLFSFDLDTLLQEFVDEVARQMSCRGVALILIHPKHRKADRVAVAGQFSIPPASELNASIASGVLGEALQHGTLLIPTGQELRTHFRSSPDMKAWAKRNLLLVRLQRSAPLGCLVVADKQGEPAFSDAEVQTLTTAARAAAGAVENAWRFEKLQTAVKERQGLLHAIISTHDQEQKRVGEEWYERVGGTLFHVLREFRMFQEFLNQQLPEGKERFEALAAELDTVAALVRSFADELHPTALDNFGFVAALREYVAGLHRQESFRVTVQAENVDPQLPSEANLSLFRITQEAVQNIRKHAQARNVEIALVQEHSGVSLMIKDDGQGFNVTQPQDGHYGLLYMRERAEACGGEFHVRSARGQGTEIRVAFPLGGERGHMTSSPA